jgi:hypothetical protein
MGLLSSKVFASGELSNANKWWVRVLSPVSTALTTRLGDNAWIAPTLGNSWVNTGGATAAAGYRIRDGVVYLRGSISNGTLGNDAPAGIAFTLPAGYRPDRQLMFCCQAGTGFARVDVFPSGAVYICGYGGGGSNSAVALSPVCFPVGTSPGPAATAPYPNVWPMTQNPIPDFSPATAAPWWAGLFKPTNDAIGALDADDSGWQPVIGALSNGWAVAFGGFGWPAVSYRRRRGIIYLAGIIAGGSTGIVFTMPPGFQPLLQVSRSVIGAGPGAAGSSTEFAQFGVDVTSTGGVFASAPSFGGNNGLVSLSGVNFEAQH